MKIKYLLSTLFILNLFLTVSCDAQLLDFDHNGVNRKYLYHAPTNLPANAPLVVVLHGYTGNASGIQDYSNMNAIADQYGFAVCYPQGKKDDSNNRFFNVGYDFHNNETIDDVGFLVELAAYLQNQHSLSPDNTFATGLSNGGDMCYLLACDAPGTFKAIAPVAGMMLDKITNTCKPTAVPVFEIHGTNDDVTYIDGDPNNQDGWGAYPALQTTIDFWVEANGCTTQQTNNLPDINSGDGSYVVSVKYQDGVNGNEVWYYKVISGGHDWPGAWGNMDIVASEEIWLFFSNFLTPISTDVNTIISEDVKVLYPNPVEDFATMELDSKMIGLQYSIIDVMGRTINQHTIQTTTTQIPTTSLSSGIYFIQIEGTPQSKFKLVKK